MENDIKLFEEIKGFFSSMEQEDLAKDLDCLGLPEERKNTLIDLISENLKMEFYSTLDVFLYALKIAYIEKFMTLNTSEHLKSKGDLYEYDPSKNGSNIIKHGISFHEVVSYASKFGALMVSCPDRNDSERVVIFSDLYNLKGVYSLDLPLNSDGKSDGYVVSIAHCRNNKFRFISSRIMSKKSHKKTLKNALKNIYPDNAEKKEQFIDRCLEILNQNLFATDT